MVCVEIRTAGGALLDSHIQSTEVPPNNHMQHNPRTAVLPNIKKPGIQKAYLWVQQCKTASHCTSMYSMDAL